MAGKVICTSNPYRNSKQVDWEGWISNDGGTLSVLQGVRTQSPQALLVSSDL